MNFHSIRNNLKVWYIQVYQELILDVLIQNYSSEIPNRKVSLNFHNVWEVPENFPKFLLVAICRFHRSASLTFSQVISSTIKVGAQRVNMINMIQNLITRPSIDYKSAGDSRQLNIDQLHGRSTGQWIESARLFLDKNLVNLINKNLWFNSIRSGSDDFTENLFARPPFALGVPWRTKAGFGMSLMKSLHKAHKAPNTLFTTFCRLHKRGCTLQRRDLAFSMIRRIDHDFHNLFNEQI